MEPLYYKTGRDAMRGEDFFRRNALRNFPRLSFGGCRNFPLGAEICFSVYKWEGLWYNETILTKERPCFVSYPFFPMIARMKYITRWGLMRNTDPENIQEHSHMVAALYHDASEILTGDLPTPIKYDNPDIQGAYKSVEAMAERKLLSMLPEEFRPVYEEALTIPDPEVRSLVKAADKLSAYLKCVEERKAGNLEFKNAEEQIYSALRENPLPALDYFMERFLPGFQLTLDELQRSGDEIFGQMKLDLTSGKD